MSDYKFINFKLIVTGVTEEQCLPDFFRELTKKHCSFKVIRKSKQLNAKTPSKKVLSASPRNNQRNELDKYYSEFGKPARDALKRDNNFVIIIDDLEKVDIGKETDKYNRYRDLLDKALGRNAHKASVHFFKPMIEAYFLADLVNTNLVLGTSIQKTWDNPEECIKPSPYSILNRAIKPEGDNSVKYHKVKDGTTISKSIDLKKVLENPEHCTYLRSLVKWMVDRFWQDGCETTFNRDDYHLDDGLCAELTSGQ